MTCGRDAWRKEINGRLTLAGAGEISASDEWNGVCAIAAVCAKPPVSAGEIGLLGSTGVEGDAGAGALVGVELVASGEHARDEQQELKGDEGGRDHLGESREGMKTGGRGETQGERLREQAAVMTMNAGGWGYVCAELSYGAGNNTKSGALSATARRWERE